MDRVEQLAPERLIELPKDTKGRQGFVPYLLPDPQQHLSWRRFRQYPKQRALQVVLPCSTARGEDAAVLHSFFTDRTSGEPLRGGTFLEIGGVDGFTESNTWIFEACLGWQGVLIEAQPLAFASLKRNRPRSLNLRMAACRHDAGWVDYTSTETSTARVAGAARGQPRPERTIRVECGALGKRLLALNVRRLDFLSIDVEGAELTVAESLVAAPGISLGVVLVEVRNDGQRLQLLRLLLAKGMRYVGQIEARGTMINHVIDDVYVNLSHVRRYFPTSVALGGPPPMSSPARSPSSRSSCSEEVAANWRAEADKVAREGRHGCCIERELEFGRAGRCSSMAGRGKCGSTKIANDCPVACKRCRVCPDHPLYEQFALLACRRTRDALRASGGGGG